MHCKYRTIMMEWYLQQTDLLNPQNFPNKVFPFDKPTWWALNFTQITKNKTSQFYDVLVFSQFLSLDTLYKCEEIISCLHFLIEFSSIARAQTSCNFQNKQTLFKMNFLRNLTLFLPQVIAGNAG